MVASDPLPSPAPVLEAAEAARRYVSEAIGFDVDGTDETLPVVDHYLDQVPRERADVRDLVATAVGCYFGEVVRRTFPARWEVADPDPHGWRLTLIGYAVHFYPVAIAHRAILGAADPDDAPDVQDDELAPETDEHDDAIHVEGPERGYVEQALAAIPPVSEREYYSLSGRFDSLGTVVELINRCRAFIADADGETN